MPADTHSAASLFFTTMILSKLPRVIIYNTAIALFMTAATPFGFWQNFVYSQGIGLGIFLALHASCRLRGKSAPELVDVMLGLPFGFIVGFALGTWAVGFSLVEVMRQHPQAVLISAAAALLFGLIATIYFVGELRLETAEAEVRAEKLRRAEQETFASRAELRLLQSQIEPHFLFNTLSVIADLVESRPAAARTMLLDLVSLLRDSLVNTRQELVSLDEELTLLRAYLAIMGERMGERLSFDVTADAEARRALLPPLLVQPLVENAIRHGLEPKIEGGTLRIASRCDRERLIVEVIDNGLGVGNQATGGIGLANIRERLANHYGTDGTLSLIPNPEGHGLVARIEIPYICVS